MPAPWSGRSGPWSTGRPGRAPRSIVPARLALRLVGELAAEPADLVLRDQAELGAQGRGAVEPGARLGEGEVDLHDRGTRDPLEPADLRVADPAGVGLRRAGDLARPP